jgi:hypothetical protein
LASFQGELIDYLVLDFTTSLIVVPDFIPIFLSCLPKSSWKIVRDERIYCGPYEIVRISNAVHACDHFEAFCSL